MMRTLPPDTQPNVVIVALCAMLGRAIGSLEASEKADALPWAVSLISIEGGVGPPN